MTNTFSSNSSNVIAATEALRLLKMALEKNAEDLAWARRDPDFERIRDDPRFAALLEEMT
jgi:hypothetical protein